MINHIKSLTAVLIGLKITGWTSISWLAVAGPMLALGAVLAAVWLYQVYLSRLIKDQETGEFINSVIEALVV